MLTLLAFIASQAAAPEALAAELFRGQHLGDERQLSTALDAEGRVITVIGRFDIGLDAESSADPSTVAEALAVFLGANADAFGCDDDFGLGLTHHETLVVDDELRVMRFMQVLGRDAIQSSEVSVTLYADGALHSVNGAIGRASDYSDLFFAEPSPESVAAVAAAARAALISHGRSASQIGVDALASPMALVEGLPGRNHFVSVLEDVAIERQIAVDGLELVWLVDTPQATVQVSDLGDVISVASKLRHNVAACNSRHSDYSKFFGTNTVIEFSAGDVCDISDCDPCGLADCSDLECGCANGVCRCVNEGGKSGTTLGSAISCDGDNFFGTCTWKLKREEGGLSHGMARVEDESGFNNELEISDPGCDTPPTFNSANVDDLEEQTALYSIHRSRLSMLDNAWNLTGSTVDRQANVDIHVDHNSHPDMDTPAGAFFDTFQTSIHLGSLSSRDMDIMFHEYGHYAHWVYGDMSINCTQADQGLPLGESVANSFAYVTALEEMILTYSAVQGMGGGQAPQPHTNGTSRLTQTLDLFPCDTQDEHLIGRPFEQAVWELLWNRNCLTVDTCTNSMAFGNTVWIGATRDQVNTHVARSIGSALKVLGFSFNYNQLVVQVEERIRLTSGVDTRDRARAVFDHHGY